MDSGAKIHIVVGTLSGVPCLGLGAPFLALVPFLILRRHSAVVVERYYEHFKGQTRTSRLARGVSTYNNL
jgi:hypothetical protein